jgi:TM2 domain-containing membrane protein YozV
VQKHLIVIILFFCYSLLKAESVTVYFIDGNHVIIDSSKVNVETSLESNQELNIQMDLSALNINACNSFNFKKKRPSPLMQLFKRKQRTNKRVTAAILAFPFPFGIVGLHRIYLGTAPYVPVVYIASLGGVFGILPFIDFCVIALDKDLERYKENKKVFMWVND